ncbi:hypothetical protein ACF0H5_009374 [Mactra antiquata]
MLSQQARRLNEGKSTDVAIERKRQKRLNEMNRKRVKEFRLRLKIWGKVFTCNESALPLSETLLEDPYKHRSSEARAYQRILKTMPVTPAKKVRIIEKLVLKAPLSRLYNLYMDCKTNGNN